MDTAKIISVAQRLIDKNGRLVLLQQLGNTPIDSNKPWNGPGQPSVEHEYPVKGVFVPASGEAFGRQLVSDDLLQRADEVLLVAGRIGSDFSNIHIVVDNALDWGVEWVHTLRPQDEILLYAYGVKR
jgi:hypothetical protein